MCVLFALTSLCSGCDDEKPYTPFQVATSLPGAPPAPRAGDAAKEASPKKNGEWIARTPDKPSGNWRAFERTLIAPQGTLLYVGIPVPADESDSVVAWTLPKKKAAPEQRRAAGLYRFDRDGNAQEKVLGLPEYLPQGEDCTFTPQLSAAGSSAITSDLSVQCSSRFLPGTPERSVSLLALERQEPVLLHFRLLEPNSGERLDLEIHAADTDGDGTDDAQVLVSLISPTGVKESLSLEYLSRPAGASRETNEPAESLQKRVARLLTASVRKAERKEALGQIDALRRLLSALCEESGTPKVLTENGEPLTCDGLPQASFGLTQAAMQAHLGQKEVVMALSEIGRLNWYFGPKSQAQEKTLHEKLLPSVPKTTAKMLARYEVKTAGSTTAPFASPLKFASDGQLFAQTIDGKIKRLTRAGDPPLNTDPQEQGENSEPAFPEILLYPTGPSGGTLTAVVPSCDRSEAQLMFTDMTGTRAGAIAPSVLPLLAPRPGACKTLRPLDLEATPISTERGQLVFSLAGAVLRSDGQIPTDVGPLAWTTPVGIAVKTGDEVVLWTGETTRSVHHCTANREADEVACLGPLGVTVLGKSDKE